MTVQRSQKIRNFTPDPIAGSDWFPVVLKHVAFKEKHFFWVFFTNIRRNFMFIDVFCQKMYFPTTVNQFETTIQFGMKFSSISDPWTSIWFRIGGFHFWTLTQARRNDILLIVIITYFFLLFSDLKCSRSDCITKSRKSHQNHLVEENDVPNFWHLQCDYFWPWALFVESVCLSILSILASATEKVHYKLTIHLNFEDT